MRGSMAISLFLIHHEIATVATLPRDDIAAQHRWFNIPPSGRDYKGIYFLKVRMYAR